MTHIPAILVLLLCATTAPAMGAGQVPDAPFKAGAASVAVPGAGPVRGGVAPLVFGRLDAGLGQGAVRAAFMDAQPVRMPLPASLSLLALAVLGRVVHGRRRSAVRVP